VKNHGALFVTDHVTAIGGIPIEVDNIGIDAAYAGYTKMSFCTTRVSTYQPLTKKV